MTEHQPKIVVAGSINMDLVVACRQIPKPGETIMGDRVDEFGGGKGANQAVAAARCQAEVHMIGRVGSDGFAESLRAGLQEDGVHLDSVRSCRDCSSGMAIISVQHDGENAITVIPAANGQVSPSDIDESSSLIASADILMLQLEIPMPAVLRAIEIAKQHDTRVVLDPAPAPPEVPTELFQVDLICPNESEASALSGRPVNSRVDAIEAAKVLHRRGVKNIVITMGADGSIFYDGQQIEHFETFPVEVVDTTAAGDSFAGALAVRWAMTGDLRSSLSFANAAGALAASRRGAQASIADFNEIEELWRTRETHAQ